MNKAGDLLECVSDKYSEGKLFNGGVYQVERSWDCGGSEFLDLVGVPGPWAPERFKAYEGVYTTGGYTTAPITYTTAWPADGTTLTYSNPSATTVTLPDDTSHFPIGTTLTYDGTTLEIKPPAPADESAKRKAMPVCTGVLDYFGAALLEVSKLSKFGGDKHAPGQPLHHARGVSADHPDALMRHLMERGTVDPDSGLSHTVGVAWRALAMLQEELEAAGAPMARGAKVAK